MGYSPCGCKEPETAEHLSSHTHTHTISLNFQTLTDYPLCASHCGCMINMCKNESYPHRIYTLGEGRIAKFQCNNHSDRGNTRRSQSK